MVPITAPDFPVGFHSFHRNPAYNYQLNRWHSLGLMRYEDIHNLGGMQTFGDWIHTMLALADQAESEERLLNAAFFCRAAEFYTTDDDVPDKEALYRRFRDLFDRATAQEPLRKTRVPWKDAEIPVLQIPATGPSRGTVLLHGGFDSFIEEFYFPMIYLSSRGYNAAGFEGPGQGDMLLQQKVSLDYRWEDPVSAVLNAFQPDRFTLFGLSMGGWFALRAASLEPRISNVVISGHAVDYSRIPPAFARRLMMFFIRHFRKYTADSFRKMALRQDLKGWQVSNLAHITRMEPLEAFEYSLNLNEENLGCGRIRQNVLFLTGKNDHFIPFKMHDIQASLLKNARSP